MAVFYRQGSGFRGWQVIGGRGAGFQLHALTAAAAFDEGCD